MSIASPGLPGRSPGIPTPAGAGSIQFLPDGALARLVAAGDALAFEVLYERYRDDVYRYCLSITRHPQDAEEALQQTMLNAYRALSAAGAELAFRPWLFRVAHNSAVGVIRARPKADPLEVVDPPAPDDVPGEVAAREELRRLREDIFALPERQRAALVMRELGGMSHGDIGLVMLVSADEARRLVFEARQSLGEFAAGRDLACEDARRALSDGDGRVLRGRRMSAHVRACASCKAFAVAARGGRARQLAVIFPVLPALAAAKIAAALGAAGAGAGGAGTAAASGLVGHGMSSAVAGGPQAAGIGAVGAVAAATLAVVFGVHGGGPALSEPPPARAEVAGVVATPATTTVRSARHAQAVALTHRAARPAAVTRARRAASPVAGAGAVVRAAVGTRRAPARAVLPARAVHPAAPPARHRGVTRARPVRHVPARPTPAALAAPVTAVISATPLAAPPPSPAPDPPTAGVQTTPATPPAADPPAGPADPGTGPTPPPVTQPVPDDEAEHPGDDHGRHRGRDHRQGRSGDDPPGAEDHGDR